MLLNIYLFFLNICDSWISVDIKKLCRYLHNGYPTDINTGTEQKYLSNE